MFITWAALFVATSFAGVTGTIGGTLFAAVSAIGDADAAHRGKVAIMIGDQPMVCGPAGEKKGSAVIVWFEPVTGATAEPGSLFASFAQRRVGDAAATGTLTKFPTEKGGIGEVSLDNLVGEGTSLSGTIPFTLCDVITAPTPSVSEFSIQDTRTEEGDTIRVGLPKPWVKDDSPGRVVRYRGPDGDTQFAIYASCFGDCAGKPWEVNASSWGRSQYGTELERNPARVTVLRDEKVSEGTWVVRYDKVMGNRWFSYLDVLRWSPEWNKMVVCRAETALSPTTYMDTALSVCSAAELVK